MARIGFLTERMLLGFGVDLVIDRLADGLAAKGHEVKVYASLTDGTYDNKSYDVRQIPTAAYNLFPLYDRSAHRWLDMLNKEDVDVWLVSTFPFFSLLPHLKAPAVAIDYGICSTEGFTLAAKLNFAYMKWSQQRRYFPHAARVVTISDYVKSLLPSGLQDKAEVIYIGADHYLQDWDIRRRPATEAAEFRRSRGVGQNDLLLTYVGRLNPAGQPYKGTRDLMTMFSRISRSKPGVKALMVGYGDTSDARRISDLGIIPFVKAPVEMMPVVHAATDIYVTASRWEGFDLPLVEAAFFGKPGVALKIGAHPEVVRDGETALLADTIAELEDDIIELVDNTPRRVALGASAAEFAQRFRWETAVADYDAMIAQVLS